MLHGEYSTGTARQYLELNSLSFFIQGFVLYLWCDLRTVVAEVVALSWLP